MVDFSECGKCLLYYYSDEASFLNEACASVGISRGLPGHIVLRSFMKAYHDAGHKINKK